VEIYYMINVVITKFDVFLSNLLLQGVPYEIIRSNWISCYNTTKNAITRYNL